MLAQGVLRAAHNSCQPVQSPQFLEGLASKMALSEQTDSLTRKILYPLLDQNDNCHSVWLIGLFVALLYTNIRNQHVFS